MNADCEWLIPFVCKESALLSSVLRRTRMLMIQKDKMEFLPDLLYKMLTREFPENDNEHMIGIVFFIIIGI